jgi:hypothetical protein
MSTKAEEFRKKFGTSTGNTSELSKIYAEIDKIGDKCCNLIWHDPISSATMKELRKQKFNIETDNGCYIISW